MAIVDRLIDVLDSFVVRPIGLSNKDYRFMVDHLDRNIGNHDLDSFDGYSTPIGHLANPYYNAQYGKSPIFLSDTDKSLYANYIDYIKGTYGDNLSLESINNRVSFSIDFDKAKVGAIGSYDLESIISGNNSRAVLNPNSQRTDTLLGKENAPIVKRTLLNSIKENDKHDAKKFSITENMAEYFGMNTKAFQNGVLRKYNSVDKNTGRFADISILGENSSPVYSTKSKWGNYKSLGAYEEYYNSSPSATTRSFIKRNIRYNKYGPKLPDYQSNSNYLDSMKITADKASDYNGSEIRYIFSTLHTSDTEYNNEGHTTGSLIGGLKAYGEMEGNSAKSYRFRTFNSGVNFGKYSTFDTDPIGVDDLLNKTNESFRNGKYDTLIGRFHSSTDYPNDEITSTAISKAYGMSHGRNLLKKNAKNGRTFTEDGVGDGYDNPYCRVWTYHHQYHRLADAIRPFRNDDGSVMTPKQMQDNYNFGSFRTNDTVGMGSGGERLTKHGTIGYKTNGGLVNIAPKKGVDIKNCMFSIENLAWKGMFSMGDKTYQTNGLSAEQKGPFGGRIMWFPPYDIKFSENVAANWNATSFIGRGEDIYTYTNTTRDGSLSFKLLIDHPAVLDYWRRRNETDTSSNVDDVDSPEQELLRFFAGCDFLTAKKQPKRVYRQVIINRPEPAPAVKAFTFFIFYPNDYSGQDDRGNNQAMPYILNGRNANFASNGSRRVVSFSDGNGVGYEVRGNGITADEANPQIGHYGNKKTKWYYRVDDKRINEKLVLKNDYKDTRSFRLNSGGNSDAIRRTFNVNSSIPLYSFTDAYVAFTNSTAAKSRLSGFYNPSNVATITNLIKNYGIKQITVKGWASSHGITINTVRNNDLNKNRRTTAIQWLKKCPLLKNSNIIYKPLNGGVGPGPEASSVSDLKPKLYRCAEVTVYVNVEKATTLQANLSEKHAASTTSINTSSYLKGNNINPDKTRVTKFSKTNVNFKDGESIEKLKEGIQSVGSQIQSTSNLINSVNTSGLQSENAVDLKAGKTTNKGANMKAAQVTETDNTVRRYDNEADFFKGLSVEDPFMRNKITEKIKYFDPAFHSISPEGFNARLNFLHQCTRQGPTIAGSDLSDNIGVTANNLSFGRAPVCILRIGDFYYTKIIITSMSIDYDPLLWDLNQEGIGVMPMIANINLQFHFIGGSSLAGPIARLQNAISYNYYANTEVYDDRAEQVDYDSKGDIVKYKTFPY